MLPRKAPVPTYAVVDGATGLITVRFNQALRTGTSDPSNWSGRTYSAPFDYLFGLAAAPPIVRGAAVTFTPTLAAMQGGPLAVSYAATPSDLFGECSGVPVAPFVDFPMHGPPSYPQFVSGSFDVPQSAWYLTFSEPITTAPASFNPAIWRTKLGPVTKFASAVSVVAGLIRIADPSFSALDDTVVYTRQPPDWTDAEGDPVQVFSHALPA